MKDPEIEAINAINAALTSVEDAEIRMRVLRWANDKFGFVPKAANTFQVPQPSKPLRGAAISNNEIPGVAVLSPEGDFSLTIRDLKAKNTLDAARRLAHIAIRSYCLLTGQKTVSSKNVLLPALINYRVYDGNTRAALAREKGIIRKGDELELDQHAQNEADKFIAEVTDDNVVGAWTPKNRVAKRASSASTAKKAA